MGSRVVVARVGSFVTAVGSEDGMGVTAVGKNDMDGVAVGLAESTSDGVKMHNMKSVSRKCNWFMVLKK